MYVLLKFSIIQGRDRLRPQGCSELCAECVCRLTEAGRDLSTLIQPFLMEALPCIASRAGNQKSACALAKSSTVPTHGLTSYCEHKANNYSSKAAKCLHFFFIRMKRATSVPHRTSFFSFLNLTSAVISKNFTLESSSMEFLKCVNFSSCTETAAALPNQLDLSVSCQAALAICLQSTARRYINSPR